MTIRLTPPQVECLRLIRRGVKSSPPLRYDCVSALLRKGYIGETIVRGSVVYYETEKGKQFA
jgi:hypothetical protein